jgi:hypothetical protein
VRVLVINSYRENLQAPSTEAIFCIENIAAVQTLDGNKDNLKFALAVSQKVKDLDRNRCWISIM